ncbi:MAG TPA: hypothetical protein VEL76_23265 [Gemmataceae bacterium]|nr:hypothetical protein [Gemmataceae bacterium]
MRAYLLPLLLSCGLVAGLAGQDPLLSAQEPAKGTGPTLTVVDHNGKEVKLQTWKFLVGTRRVSWMAPAAPKVDKKGEKTPAGVEVLEFRDDKSTTYKDGILTLIPLTSLKKLEYDHEKKTVEVTYLATGENGPEEMSLTGSTRFIGINKLEVEAETDLGELGKAAMKFQGGSSKGVHSLTFSTPKPVPAPTGRRAIIIGRDKEQTGHKIADIQALYLAEKGREQLSSTLHFKTTVKIDLAKLEKLRNVPPADAKTEWGPDYEVTLKDGKQLTLTLLQKTNTKEGGAGVLKGLVGRVPAGYKLFPLHTIVEVRYAAAEVLFEER